MMPDLQIAFAKRLDEIRALYLAPARERTVAALEDVTLLDRELAEFVGAVRLTRLATHGIRGEVVYPTPSLLRANPQLLGYYRLLFGFSQKEFYDRTGAVFRGFRPMEERGVIPVDRDREIPALCQSLIETAALLLDGLESLSPQVLHELQVLTAGPTFRGSRNTDLGKAAVGLVFNLIRSLINERYEPVVDETKIRIVNAAGRIVQILFAADPDIAITEHTGQTPRRKVAIEVKGGTDASNRLNRLGEAEKSHLKARTKGFTEFWTIAAVPATQAEIAENSPTTTSFFLLAEIDHPRGLRRGLFEEQLASALGIAIE